MPKCLAPHVQAINHPSMKAPFRSRFNVAGISEGDVEFVYLHRRRFVEARLYPAFTLLGQSMGSVWLGQ